MNWKMLVGVVCLLGGGRFGAVPAPDSYHD
jgi:hypothetical protein